MTATVPVAGAPDRVARSLTLGMILLILGHLATMVARFGLHRDSVLGLVPLFDFAVRWNAPSLFTAGLFLLAAVRYWSLRSARRGGRAWLLLALFFLACGIDAPGRPHELLDRPIRELTGTELAFGWMAPYAVLLTLLGVALRPALRSLSEPSRAALVGAAALFVTGSLGLEAFQSLYVALRGTTRDLGFAVLTGIEGTLRMLALIRLQRVAGRITVERAEAA